MPGAALAAKPAAAAAAEGSDISRRGSRRSSSRRSSSRRQQQKELAAAARGKSGLTSKGRQGGQAASGQLGCLAARPYNSVSLVDSFDSLAP